MLFRSKYKIGYGDPLEDHKAITDTHLELEKAGMVTQLVGRTPNVAELLPLTEDDLMNILDTHIIPEFQNTWDYLDSYLDVPQSIKDEIVKNVMERKTGARGLYTDISKYVDTHVFDLEFDV